MSGNVGRGDHILLYARRDVVDLDQFVHFYTSPHMRQNVVFFCARVRQRRFCVSAYMSQYSDIMHSSHLGARAVQTYLPWKMSAW